MDTQVGDLRKFFRCNYRGIGAPAGPFPGVLAKGEMAEYGCISAKCVCKCGGGWCKPGSSTNSADREVAVA